MLTASPPDAPADLDTAERARRSWAAFEAESRAVAARAEQSWAAFEAAAAQVAERAHATGIALAAEHAAPRDP